MKNTNIAFLVLTIILTFAGCNAKKKSSDDDIISGGTNGIQAAELKGTSTVCRNGGAKFAGATGLASNGSSSYWEEMTFNLDGTYRYSQYWMQGSGCNSGVSWFAYTQAGTYLLGNLNDVVTDATNVIMTVTSQFFTAYDTYFRTQMALSSVCLPAFTFTTNTESFTNHRSCLQPTHNWNLGTTFPAVGDQAYNILKHDGNASTLTMGDNTIMFYPGSAGTTYPTTTPKVFTNYR